MLDICPAGLQCILTVSPKLLSHLSLLLREVVHSCIKLKEQRADQARQEVRRRKGIKKDIFKIKCTIQTQDL